MGLGKAEEEGFKGGLTIFRYLYLYFLEKPKAELYPTVLSTPIFQS